MAENAPPPAPVEMKYDIVTVNESGELLKTLHDSFDGWMAARTERVLPRLALAAAPRPVPAGRLLIARGRVA